MKLLPEGAAERAEALRWLLLIATEIYPMIEMNDYLEWFSPMGESAAALREAGRSIWRERWLIVERKIAGDPYVLRSGFFLTDIYIAVVSRWAEQSRAIRWSVPRFSIAGVRRQETHRKKFAITSTSSALRPDSP